jgi:hypothetical protein
MASSGTQPPPGSAAGTPTRPAATGSFDPAWRRLPVVASPETTVVATPPARPVRFRSALPQCAPEDRPYPPSAPLHAGHPAYLVFQSEARTGWRISVPDLGIQVDETAPYQLYVLLHARDYVNSLAGAHTATLTWATPTPGATDCAFPFWLKRGSHLSLTVTQAGTSRRLSGRLTWTTFGPNARAVGHPGQKIQISYRVGHKHVLVRTLATDAEGRYTTTVTSGPRLWQARYAGIVTSNAGISPAVTG